MQFDLTDLRLVVDIAQAMSITHGAARTGLALPSASERLRNLERTLGTPLFERQRRGVRPTAAGIALLHQARLVLRQIESLRAEVSELARGLRGRVRILANSAATQEVLPQILGEFLSAHPQVDIEVEERPSAEIVRGIAKGQADIGIFADAVDAAAELESFPFVEDRLMLVTPPRHPLAHRQSVSFLELVEDDFVGLSTGSALQRHLNDRAARAGYQLRLRVCLPGFDAICQLVASGIGVAIVSESAANRCRGLMPIRVIPLTDTWTLRHLRLCVKDSQAMLPPARTMLAHLRDLATSLRSSPHIRPKASTRSGTMSDRSQRQGRR